MSSERQRFTIFALWTATAVLAPLFANGMNADAITRFLITGYFAIQLIWFWLRGRKGLALYPKLFFISACSFNALIGEVCYMISTPLHPSLRITAETGLSQAYQNIAIDLLLTFPAYLLIFSVILAIITRIRYSPFSYFVLIALGQSIGDGNAFFLAQPATLIFLPYIMLNYWAMNFVPYLLIRHSLSERSVVRHRAMVILVPLVLIPATYFTAASIILTLGKYLGLLPT